MEFWSDILTRKSWEVLLDLQKKGFGFIVIGGWAAYLWTGKHKSKDLDIVLSDFSDLQFLKKNYDLRKNDRLKKYEIKVEETDVDVYVPYYSALAIPAEDMKAYAAKVQGITVAVPEALLVLKQGAELARKDSVKGQKDRIDIMAILCFLELDFGKYKEILRKYKREEFSGRLSEIVRGFTEAKYLDLNPRELKLKKKALLENMRKKPQKR